MSVDNSIRALAKRLFDCVEEGDIDGLVACYAPGAEIWHNTDRQVESPADNAAVLKGCVARIPDRMYEKRRLDVFPGGFVQQHVLSAVRATDGGRAELAACIACRMKDGMIARLDENFDSAGVAEFHG
jgi:ketosteroid isomerase-like protein